MTPGGTLESVSLEFLDYRNGRDLPGDLGPRQLRLGIFQGDLEWMCCQQWCICKPSVCYYIPGIMGMRRIVSLITASRKGKSIICF
jgi:hypothetical protein